MPSLYDPIQGEPFPVTITGGLPPGMLNLDIPGELARQVDKIKRSAESGVSSAISSAVGSVAGSVAPSLVSTLAIVKAIGINLLLGVGFIVLVAVGISGASPVDMAKTILRKPDGGGAEGTESV